MSAVLPSRLRETPAGVPVAPDPAQTMVLGDATVAAVGRANIAAAWGMISLSLVLGATVGLWAFGGPFTPPEWFGAYDDPGRRLLRLAHIAGIMLPILNLHYLRGLAGTHYRPGTARRICRLLLVGSVGLPVILALAACWQPALFLLPLPVVAVMAPVFFLAGGLVMTGWRKQGETA